MPSFLSKVFGSSKSKKSSPTEANPQLLGGKFEAVSPTVSPSAEKFPDASKAKDKDKDRDGSGFGTMFRSKSRPHLPPSSPSASHSSKKADTPHLSLRLDTEASRPGVKDVFGPEEGLLSESVILEKRLSPEEATALVRACKRAIVTRGLETLGVMHPHWYSASPALQQRLISLFLRSLASSATSPSSLAATTFTNELDETRDPHDVAAVLRWGLRHLQLPSSSSSTSTSRLETQFGKSKDWYPDFSTAEAAQNYPSNAYATILTPLIPEANLGLLNEVLEIVSALAPLAEKNSTSAGRLSMIFGLWLLVEDPRVRKGEGWKEFYERWEITGRMLEHLFLVRVRDEALKNRLPTRLLDLVKSYPFSTTPSADGLLPRTRYSTRRHPALFVRIETEVSARYKDTKGKKRLGPRVLVSRALGAQVIPSNEGDDEKNERALWTLLQESNSEDGEVDLGSVFADETLRLFELVERPRGRKGREGQVSPTFSVFPPSSSIRSPVVRSRSERETIASATSPSSTIGHSKSATDSLLQTPTMSPTTAASSIVVDWAQFSSAGFGDVENKARLAETLWDEEVEKTVPRPGEPDSVVARIRSRSRSRSRPRARKSVDVPHDERKEEKEAEDEEKLKSRVVQVSSVLIDEAFVDFWSDALTDPVVSMDWPEFVVCKLKPTLSPPEQAENEKKVEYLVLEHSYSVPPPPPPPPLEATSRAGSPRPSMKEKKRFSFFSSSTSGRPSISGRGHSGSVNSMKSRLVGGKLKVGEMGEVLREEEERPATVKVKVPVPKGRKSLAKEEEGKKEGEVAAGVVTGAVAAAAVSEAAPVPTTEATPAEADSTPKVEDAPTSEAAVEQPAEADATPKAEILSEEAPVVEAASLATDVVGTTPAEEPTPAPVITMQPEEIAAAAFEPVGEKAEEPATNGTLVVEQPASVEEPSTPAPAAQEPTEQPVEAEEASKVDAVSQAPSETTPSAEVTAATTEAQAEEPVASEVAVKEPVVIEVPVVEQPAAEESLVVAEPEEQVASTAAEPVVQNTEEPIVAEAPVVEQPADIEEPVAPAPATQESTEQPSEAVEGTQPQEPATAVASAVTEEPEVAKKEEDAVASEPHSVAEEPEAETLAVVDETPITVEPIVDEVPAAEQPAIQTAIDTEDHSAAAEEKHDEPLPAEPVAEEAALTEQESTLAAEPEVPTATEVEATPATEPETTAPATEESISNTRQEPPSSINIPIIVAEVDVTPHVADSGAPVLIEVVRPTPTASDAGEDKMETTARAPGPGPTVEYVLLAEDAKEPIEVKPEPEVSTETANGTSQTVSKPDNENIKGEDSPDAPAEETAPLATETTDLVAGDVAQTSADATIFTVDSSSPANGDDENVASTDDVPVIEGLKVAHVVPSNGNADLKDDVNEAVADDTPASEEKPTEVVTPEPVENNENIISAVPQVEPLPTDAEDTVEDKLVDLPAVPIVEPVIPPSNPPADAFESVPITEPEVPASEETAVPEVAAGKEEGLPAAPETVVLAGSTPGPALALSTSEPAVTDNATNDATVTESSETPPEQTNGKHVEEASNEVPVSPSNGSTLEAVQQETADKD